MKFCSFFTYTKISSHLLKPDYWHWLTIFILFLWAPEIVALDYCGGRAACNDRGTIFGYIEPKTSGIHIGDRIRVHVSSDSANYQVNISRVGGHESITKKGTNGVAHNIPAKSYATGVNWNTYLDIKIPADFNSGIYKLEFTAGGENSYTFFSVQEKVYARHAKILILDHVTTEAAYHNFGGKSLYGFNSTDSKKSDIVSLERPMAAGQWQQINEFASWMDEQDISYEAASMLDVHFGWDESSQTSLLDAYNLVLIVGHNEYWSRQMRDAYDAYLANGGNVAIFSGNTMWWQIRISPDGKKIICYKSDRTDPETGINDSLVTTNWYRNPVNHPENSSIGVSWRFGGFHNSFEHYIVDDDLDNGLFTVPDPTHWAFKNTSFADKPDAQFGRYTVRGKAKSILGYETDGVHLAFNKNGQPSPLLDDQTPTNFEIIAYAAAFAQGNPSGNTEGYATIGVFQPEDASNQIIKGSGTVFVAPTVYWADGLATIPDVATITRNVISKLKVRTAPVEPEKPSQPKEETDPPVEPKVIDSTNPNPEDKNPADTQEEASIPPAADSVESGSGGGGGASYLFIVLLLLAGYRARNLHPSNLIFQAGKTH